MDFASGVTTPWTSRLLVLLSDSQRSPEQALLLLLLSFIRRQCCIAISGPILLLFLLFDYPTPQQVNVHVLSLSINALTKYHKLMIVLRYLTLVTNANAKYLLQDTSSWSSINNRPCKE
jgi:hypothetical protein